MSSEESLKHFSRAMETPVFVKGPGGQYISDLVQACEEHFSRIYPEYVNSCDHDTVMCPSAFLFGYIAPTGQASGATPLNNIEKASIDGDNAELKIFHMLEKFGKETNPPMFVLAQVKITEFIKDVLRQKLPADHPILSADKLVNLDGEIDFVIIHRQIGVILMEVKAQKKFSKSTQSKARKQLQMGEEIIHALSHADHKTDYNESTIPVYKVIAMPNVSEPGRQNRNFISLREENVQSDENFVRWWENNFAKRAFGGHEKRELQNLIYIFVGQKSEVCSKVPSKVLSDVCRKIDQQKFLQKSYEWGTKQGEDESQVVLKTTDRPEQAILAKQFLFLNPEQLRIWSGPHQQFFNGSSGSGKTILLQFKALECAKQGEKVVIVVPSSLTSLYKEFFAKNSISSGVDILSPSGISGLFQRRDPAVKFHFFADELQAFEAEISDVLIQLGNLLSRIAYFDCYCWVAYDYMQRNGNEVSPDETGGLADGLKIQAQARELCKTYNIYHAPCLKTTVRSTFEVYTFVQEFVKVSLLDLLQRLKLPRFDFIGKETKEIFTQFVENYDVSNHLGHHICGPSVQVVNVMNSDLDFISQVVQNEIHKWADSLHYVAVLVTTSFLKERLSHLMSQKGIAVCDVADNQKNAVVLDFGHKAHSYEWPVVVAISWFNNDLSSKYTMFTRAISRLVVVKNEEVPV